MNLNYNYPTTIFRSIFARMYNFSGRNIYIYNFYLRTFQGQNEKLQIIPEIHIFLGQNACKYCSQIIVDHVHANGFL